MTSPVDRFRTVLQHRIDVAARWHGLRKRRHDVWDFIAADPNVASMWADERI